MMPEERTPRRFRLDGPHQFPSDSDDWTPEQATREGLQTRQQSRLQDAIERTRDFLLQEQQTDGHWVAELEGDTILESEYILLLAYLGQQKSPRAINAARYIEQQQLPTGGWAIYPGGDLEISASVKSYWVLKLTGHDPEAPYMVRAREAIRNAGGAEAVNSFTRYYFALLGIIDYKQCPAVPPELMLLPSWMPFNIYEMSAWSRTILVPLSLLWAFQPSHKLPTEGKIDELFLKSPGELSVTMGVSAQLDTLKKKTTLPWDRMFRWLDQGIKLVEKCGLKPFRTRSIQLAKEWMFSRFEHSDGLGAIFPPIIWSVVALKCLGYSDDSPEVQRQMNELERLVIEEGSTVRLQPCKSPVWDTAIATMALREIGLPADHPALRRASRWLLSKEVRQPGDWSLRTKGVEPAGWFFEYENAFYPDVDDTIMVSMALNRCIPHCSEGTWATHFLNGEPFHIQKDQVTTIISGHVTNRAAAFAEIESVSPFVDPLRRAVRWTTAMQNRDGGWGAFDVNNDRELFTRVPFADHNAMIDPSTPDITARVLEMFGRLGISPRHPAIERGIEFIWKTQEQDGSWIGRWGVNYLYGTWQVLVGLHAVGVPDTDSRIRKAVQWLEQAQQPCGGWGESPRSYEDPTLKGQGEPTPSQTAWALMGLCAAGEANSQAVERGIQYLLDTQLADGTWDEKPYTGTGFPKVFYLRYHYYRIYFPLMALGRAARLRHQLVSSKVA
ncbi:MAG: prenyltransferase/squalene oxidase repeat-containing protein [Planctomycetales bacterium]